MPALASRTQIAGCSARCICPSCKPVGRRAAIVKTASYHSNWRTAPTNGANGTALATRDVPRQLQNAARPLPIAPVQRPTPDSLNSRYASILKHFPNALGVDDFIARVEVALCYFGFTGDNTIGRCCAPAAPAVLLSYGCCNGAMHQS